jgi:hypothetical protein
MSYKQDEIGRLRAALMMVRADICRDALDTVWHEGMPAETTVDYITNILQDGWDYDEWLASNG